MSNPDAPRASPAQTALSLIADSPQLPGAPVGVIPAGAVGAALVGLSPERWVARSSVGEEPRRLRRTASLPVPGACAVAGPVQFVPIDINEHGVSPGTYTHCDGRLGDTIDQGSPKCGPQAKCSPRSI
ncbi:hypothetical protein VZT92_016802 [Zoarces viviparus]|uniref:Uncharacterized protein n=1 Tax=Zoarces viviparus TaxID=48416 RepID=A0AAW1EP82_ZOAVI